MIEVYYSKEFDCYGNPWKTEDGIKLIDIFCKYDLNVNEYNLSDTVSFDQLKKYKFKKVGVLGKDFELYDNHDSSIRKIKNPKEQNV